MDSTFDSLNAARELERAGMDRPQAEAVATAIRAGQGNLATREDVLALRAEMSAMRWMMGIQMAISLGTLAAVVTMALD
ncbi:MAG: hypothetical protein OXJ53_16380 [Gammaproteobacteria bacterium]|nr:hypothetical protein [Gammaproteobacteria bacterium]MCZ0944629.1 hypothetical protein [Gammaproteobacteria bacterium]MDD9960948.1 hypothetical protein [Gammaproteobacteria bacterium]MDE0271248.1 hypothetical protein [Gammaproteobacteria bacterium]